MLRFLLTLLSGLILISCDNLNEEKKLKEIFNHTTYDTSIQERIAIYDSLKNVAITNIDTIFKFRNSRHIITEFDRKGNETKQQIDEIYYDFFYKPETKEFTDYDGSAALPEFLVPKFRAIFEQLKEKNNGFTLWNDSTLELRVADYYDEKINADVSHELIWKRRFTYDPQSLMKDTTIAPGWTYYISVEKRQGR